MAEDAPVETPVAEAAAAQSEEGGVTKPGEWKATDNKIFKHWVRPRISQYRYLDDYRYNYYDDVLDYLDKRQKGISRDIPRPQYWAERVIRTNRKYDLIESEKLQHSYQSIHKRETRRLTRTLSSMSHFNTYNCYHNHLGVSRYSHLL